MFPLLVGTAPVPAEEPGQVPEAEPVFVPLPEAASSPGETARAEVMVRRLIVGSGLIDR